MIKEYLPGTIVLVLILLLFGSCTRQLVTDNTYQSCNGMFGACHVYKR